MKERLQKILSSRGVASRRQAEIIIEQGRITCNGVTCNLGDSADPDTDEILLDGKPLPSREENVYIMLHKPKGYVTTLCDELGRRNAAQLVSDCGKRVYPVGRLDMDSEGLLLFTNDGAFANAMMHPKHEISKVYEVTVKNFGDEKLNRLKKPVRLDGYLIHSPKVELIDCNDTTARLRIEIHEGRNRQVRRMCAIADMQVKRLVRVSEGDLELGNLPCGKWRYLTKQEMLILRKSLPML